MEGGTAGKPYTKAIDAFPQHKAEIMALKQKYCQVIAAFPYKVGRYGMEEEDYFATLVLLCLEADQRKRSRRKFQEQAYRQITGELERRKKETQKLYNSFRNLCLDKCYGEGKVPLGSWMNFKNEEDE